MRPYDLRCEYRVNPLGLDVQAPRFYWKLQGGGERGARQSMWRLQVADNPRFENPCWDSGEREGAQSTHVAYEGETLRPRTCYFWRVQAWDAAGRSGGFGEEAWFETGLMNEGWKARWISADADPSAEACPLLRREFHVDGPVRRARVYATAKGMYRLWINGQPVSADLFTPGWTVYRKRIQYQAYDVTALLRDDGNAIGAMLANGWYRGRLGWERKDLSQRPPRELLAQLHILYEDGREQVLTTGSEWKACDGPLLFSEIYDGERYDARAEVPRWSQPNCEAGDWRDVLVSAEGGRGVVVAQDGLPVRAIQELRPKRLLKTPAGEAVLDMGQNMVGHIRLRVRGNAGDRVSLRCFEVLDREGNVYTDNLRDAEQRVVYTLRGDGDEIFQPMFTFMGFQYVHIEQWPGEPSVEDFTGVVVHSDMEPTGRFSCNDELVNQLQHNIVWGQKGNFVDVPTDCPQRDERLGWTGDAQVFISTACYNFMTAPFYTKWLRDMAADQLENGGIPFVVPNMLGGDGSGAHSSAAWGDAATVCPWTVYEYYGDRRALEDSYQMMKGWVEYIRKQGDDEALWNTGFHFGDWLALDAPNSDSNCIGATSRDLIATAYYALSTRLTAQAANILGYEDDADEYDKLYRKVRRAFRDEFVTPSGRLACPTQTAQVLGLHFDLLDKPSRKRAVRMLQALLQESKNHLMTGFVGTPYLCHALSDNGLHETACELALQKDYPSWLYPVTRGATTMWEHWDGIKPDGSFWSPGMNSYNHYAYGAIGDWLYRDILGIAPDPSRPGFANTNVAPQPGPGFSEASGSLMTLFGEVSVAWKLADGLFRLDLRVPDNAGATVMLPGASKGAVTESGVKLSQAEGVCDVQREDEGVSLRVGSGSYRFEYTLQDKE